MNGIKRKIVKIERYRFYKAHGDSVILHLECGHYVGRKDSEGIPKSGKTVCWQCGRGQ